MIDTKYWNLSDELWLIENYPTKGLTACCDKIKNKTKEQIITKCRKLKLKLTKELRSEAIAFSHIKREKNHKFHVDPSQFITIKTPEIAYILGLLWADGTIRQHKYENTIALECQLEDIKIFLPIFLSTGKWKCYYRNRINRKPQGCIRTNNKPLVNFLKDNDYNAKSIESAYKILSKIPVNLKHYWFRGFLDGDGCITKDGRIEFSSSINQKWDFITLLFDSMNIKYKTRILTRIVKGKTHSASSIRLSKKNSIPFSKYIYQNYEYDNIGLQRKYNRYKEYIIKTNS